MPPERCVVGGLGAMAVGIPRYQINNALQTRGLALLGLYRGYARPCHRDWYRMDPTGNGLNTYKRELNNGHTAYDAPVNCRRNVSNEPQCQIYLAILTMSSEVAVRPAAA